MENTVSKGLIPEINIANVARSYEIARGLVKEGYEKLKQADKILKETFGDNTYIRAMPNNYQYTEENLLREMNKQAWAQFIKWINIESIMSAKDIEELTDKIYNSNNRYDRYNNKKDILPEFTYEELQSTIMGAVQNSNDIFRKAIEEVWDLCTPGKHQALQKLKTNKNNGAEVGKHVILHNMVEGSCYYQKNIKHAHWQIRYDREKILHQLDKVFHLLDGKKYDPRGNTLVAKITTLSTHENVVETEYFTCKLYFNENLHIVFKRPDLVTKINASVGYSSHITA